MAKSGYDPLGMPLFFERLQKLSKFSQSNAPEFFRTHPLTTSRIADSIARAESYPKKIYENSHAYELVRYKLLAKTIKIPINRWIIILISTDNLNIKFTR